jgi:hypothetical protein
MNEPFTLYDFVKSLTIPDLATILLSLIVGLMCLGGMIFTLVRRKRHHLVSIVTIILLLLMAANFIIIPVARIYTAEYLMVNAFRDQTMENEILRTKGKITDEDRDDIFRDKARKLAQLNRAMPSIFSLIELLLQIILIILMLVAIFQRRGQANSDLQVKNS